MRIVIDLQPCQNGSRRRGIGRYSMAITRAMLNIGRGHEFIVVLNEAFPDSIGEIRKELGDLLPQDSFVAFSVPGRATAADPANAWRNRTSEMARSHFLQSLTPDLVFIPSLNEGLWDDTVVSVEKDASYLTAVTLYDLIPLEDPERHLGGEHDRNAYLRRLGQIRRADLVLPISNYVAEDAIARLQLLPERVVIAHCGVEGHFVPQVLSEKAKASLLADYGISRPYVMTASPFEPRKNLDGLIAGFASVSREIRDAHQLVLVGRMDAFARSYLGDLAQNEGLPKDALVFAGYAPDCDLPALYHHSSVFAFPSFSEGFGLPLLEAMASGAPVVGSNRTSIPEVVGREDLLCDPSDAIAIGAAIERILSSSELQHELRAYGPRRAAQFTWEKSASSVLAAFEALYDGQRGAAVCSDAAAELPSGWRTLAYVMADVSIEHRLAGINNALVAALADVFDVTIIDVGSSSLGSWISANCAVQDIDWFERHSAQFDHVVCITDVMADAALRELISRYVGTVLIVERLSLPARDALTGRKLFDGAQLALYDLEGIGALCSAAESLLSSEDVAGFLQRDLVKRAGQAFFEAEASIESLDGASSELLLGILPTAPSQGARNAFRDRADIPETDELIVAVAATEASAEEIIRAFREVTTDQRQLLVFCDVPQTDDVSSVTRLFGNVIRISGELDHLYCGLVSGADHLLVDAGLPKRMRVRIEADGIRVRTFPFAQKNAADALREISASTKINDCMVSSLSGTNRTEAVSTILQALLHRSESKPKDQALQAFARRVPAEVRGIRPDGHDLARLATSLARNEAHGNPSQLFIDVTALAKPDPVTRLDLGRRTWLSTLFRKAGRHLRPVYFNGNDSYLANRFVGTICGFEKPSIPDDVVFFKPGDRILGMDICHAFSDSTIPALKAGQQRGLSVCYAALSSFALDRPDVVDLFADMLLTWCADLQLATHPTVFGLPQGDGERAAWRSHQRDERISALIEAGVLPNVLTCNDIVAETFGAEVVMAPLSPKVMEVYDWWSAARRKPAATTEGKPSAASEFGHVVAGHLLGSYSLAIINRMMARTLEAHYPGQVRYLAIETVPINHTEGVPVDEKPLMMELSSRPPITSKGEIVLSHHYPVLQPKGNYALSLAIFFWEESQVPSETIKKLTDGFDAIISPARSVTRALIDSGLSLPIATIGQPVDVDHYAALAQRRRSRHRQATFLHVSSCFKRKGVDVLLSAWAQAFTSADKVRLLIKTFPNPHNDVESQVALLRAQYPDLAPIVIVNRDADVEEMPQFYADADVMVLPTRGEGYNLPALEAMAAGLPLIVTGHGGHRDFCSDQEARLIAYRFAKSESHVGGYHSFWVEPDVDDLVAALREQIDESQLPLIEARRNRAMLAAMRESDKEAWLRRYDALIERLQKSAHLASARVAWISTWSVQCGIAQYSSYLLDHFSEELRRNVLVVCDNRTQPSSKAEIAFKPTWDVKNVPKVKQMLEAIADYEAEAVVIQHQDGLLPWKQLGQLAHDQRLAGKVVIVVLHNAGNMIRAGREERAMIIEGLGKLSRILVHNAADMNFLMSLGLKHNVGLLPHGAFTKDQAPWPRRLSTTDAPIIGCHGFFFRHKGIDKLIRAAALMRQEWPNLKLRLVNARFPEPGHDAYINECKNLAIILGMADAIEWHQDFLPIEEVDALLASCDVIALPYDESDDSASGAVRVAMASMIPLLATKVKIFGELGDAAEWVDSNAPDLLADALASLLRSPERRRTVQAAMYEWLMEHDWKRVSGTLEGMIQGLVKERRLGWDGGRDL